MKPAGKQTISTQSIDTIGCIGSQGNPGPKGVQGYQGVRVLLTYIGDDKVIEVKRSYGTCSIVLEKYMEYKGSCDITTKKMYNMQAEPVIPSYKGDKVYLHVDYVNEDDGVQIFKFDGIDEVLPFVNKGKLREIRIDDIFND